MEAHSKVAVGVESERLAAICLPLAQVVEEGWPQSGVGSEIMAIATEEAFDFLDAAPERITGAEVRPDPPPPPPPPGGAERIVECCVRTAHQSLAWSGPSHAAASGCCPLSTKPLESSCGGLRAIALHFTGVMHGACTHCSPLQPAIAALLSAALLV